MIHLDKKFKRYIESLAAQHNFLPTLLEKDYYLTLILNEINFLSNKLIFKGGTCLNKIYFNYFRLSEDLDFIMEINDNNINRKQRKELIKPLKDNISVLINKYGLKIDNINSRGFNESKQYLFIIQYNSVFYESIQNIKLEVSIRVKHLMEPEIKMINHVFVHPFTNEPVLKYEKIKCLNLLEAVAEKLRAAATRKDIAPRDFYDLYYISRIKPELWNAQLLKIFLEKLNEDGFVNNPEKYIKNLGRNKIEIDNMKNLIDLELLSVLKNEEKAIFNINIALEVINRNYLKMLDK